MNPSIGDGAGHGKADARRGNFAHHRPLSKYRNQATIATFDPHLAIQYKEQAGIGLVFPDQILSVLECPDDGGALKLLAGRIRQGSEDRVQIQNTIHHIHQ